MTFRCFVVRVNLTLDFKEVENHVCVRYYSKTIQPSSQKGRTDEIYLSIYIQLLNVMK